MLAEEPSAENVRQRQSAETRSQLLEAAEAVFGERGYQATSVGAITDRANTAHGTFYLYFKNKEDVFCQVMETVIGGELAAEVDIPEEATTWEALEYVIGGFLTKYSPHSGLWKAVLEGAFQSDRIQERWLALRRVLVDRVIAGVELGMESGQVRRLRYPTLSANALAAMTEWFAFIHYEIGEPPPSSGDNIRPATDALVDLWYHALYGVVNEEDVERGR
jgi:AcrR family transcriptional regulator